MGWDKQKKTSISVKCQDYVVRSEKSQREVRGGQGKVKIAKIVLKKAGDFTSLFLSHLKLDYAN